MKKTWLIIKKYWKLLALVVGAFIAFFFVRSRGSFVEDYKKIKNIHDEEIKTIDEARKNERIQKQKAIVIRDNALKAIDKEYEKKSDSLKREKKQDVAKLVKEHGNDPERLAEELQKVTGFKIIQPDKNA